MAAGRLQRWSLFLSNFNYNFKYIKGIENVKADALSRLPLEIAESNAEEDDQDYLHFLEQSIPMDVNSIRSETRRDPVLGKIVNFIRYGFPESNDDSELQPYFSRKDELTVDNGVIMWGYRVIIPSKLRLRLLKELHSAHEGIVKMKSNARAYFWWPKLDVDIEQVVKLCEVCLSVRPELPKSKIIPCKKGSYFFERVHADFLGPFHNKMILIISDTYSKWLEAFIMRKTDANSTIEKFRECFARFGFPKVVVTDNGPQFTSGEFSQFLSNCGIQHWSSPPYHPQTNGFAENSVKNFKNGITKLIRDSKNTNCSFETLMNRYLYSCRNSVHVSTGVTPSSLVFKTKVRTRLDILNTKSNSSKIEMEQEGRDERFVVGEKVYCRDYRNPNRKAWKCCIIDEVINDRMYLCKLIDEQVIWKRHLNQIMRVLPSVNDLPGIDCNLRDLEGNIFGRSDKSNEHLISNSGPVIPTRSDPQQICKEKSSVESKVEVSDCISNKTENVVFESTNVKRSETKSKSTIENNTATSDYSKKERPKRNIRPPERLNL